MKLGIITTAALSLVLGIAVPAYAQEQHEEQKDQQEQKDQPAKPEQKKAQPEEKKTQEAKPAAKQEEKGAQQEKSSKQEEKTRSSTMCSLNPASRHSTDGFPMTATGPTSDANTLSASAKVIIGTAVSSMAATPSDSSAYGRRTGSTRKTSSLLISAACITCATPYIRASISL